MRDSILFAILFLVFPVLGATSAVPLATISSPADSVVFFDSDGTSGGTVSVALNGSCVQKNVPLKAASTRLSLFGLKSGTNTLRLTAAANSIARGSIVIGNESRDFALTPGQSAYLKIARAGSNKFDFKVAALAPDNPSPRRVTLGIGEFVKFTCSPSAIWSLDGDGELKTNKGSSNTYHAPGQPGTGTVYCYFPDGSHRQCTFTTIAPTDLTFVSTGPAKGINAKNFGVGMVMDVTVQPTTVSFKQCSFKEDDVAASNITGFFSTFNSASSIFASHNPSKTFQKVDSQNVYGDTAATQFALTADLVTQLQNSQGGSFTFSIPARYLRLGDAGDGTLFDKKFDQVFLILPNGAMRVTKGAATITRAGPVKF